MILLFHVIIPLKANRLCLEKSNNYCLCIISIYIDITETCGISGNRKVGYKRNKSWKT